MGENQPRVVESVIWVDKLRLNRRQLGIQALIRGLLARIHANGLVGLKSTEKLNTEQIGITRFSDKRLGQATRDQSICIQAN